MFLTHYKELAHTTHLFVNHTTLIITLCVALTCLMETSQLKDFYCHYWYTDIQLRLQTLTLVFTATYCQSNLLTRPPIFML